MARNGWGVWQFIGPGLGAGTVHMIVDMSDGWVATWSAPTVGFGDDDTGCAGFSWLGPRDVFNREFKRVG